MGQTLHKFQLSTVPSSILVSSNWRRPVQQDDTRGSQIGAPDVFGVHWTGAPLYSTIEVANRLKTVLTSVSSEQAHGTWNSANWNLTRLVRFEKKGIFTGQKLERDSGLVLLETAACVRAAPGIWGSPTA